MKPKALIRTIVLVFVLVLGLNVARAADAQAVAARVQSAMVVVVVGEADATGFLISRDPPLIATNAHVATLAAKPEEIIVRANVTGTVGKVKAIHIHKDFKQDQGKKNPYSPDLAILELEDTHPDLGAPLVLAPPKHGEDLRGCEIIYLGFPNYVTPTGERESAEAVIRRGLVQRMVDLDGSTTTTPIVQRRMLEHDLGVLPGESGGPILSVSSGSVIAVHHGTRRFYKKGTRDLIVAISVAMHADLLWEVAEQAGLTEALQQAGQ